MKLLSQFSLSARLIALLPALLILAACSSDDKSTDLPPVVDETETQATEQAAEGVTETVDETSKAEVPTVVEESVGEPDESEAVDQPIALAQAPASTPAREWKFKEGVHFERLVPTQPTIGGADKIEVAEFFWYGCGHCYEFESYISQWEPGLSPNARFERVPATWNPLVKLHAQLYYAEQVLVSSGKIADPKAFRAAVFNEYHRRENRLTSLTAIKDLFALHKVSEADFDNAWGSFEVAQKLRVAQDLAKRYAITGVPAMVVNGKYRTGKAEAGTYPVLLEVVDELVERESIK